MWHIDFNIVAYTSVIPAEATEVKYEAVKHTFHHGESTGRTLIVYTEMIYTAVLAPERESMV